MTTAGIMRITLAALIPGALVYAWMFGPGVLMNLVFAIGIALLVEAAMLRLRDLPLRHLSDGTAILTAVLLALCLPPLLPFWMTAVGIIFALVFGKHMYGGLGQNLFNPAMVGFAVLIIAFPLAMTQWPEAESQQDFGTTLTAKLTLEQGRVAYDGITAATPLDAYKFRRGETNEEFFDEQTAANQTAWLNINLAFLLGGAYLLYRRIIPWQTPIAMLGTILLLSAIYYDGGSSASLGAPFFHLFSGAAMLTAFFIVTDPVTAPMHRSGLLYYGAGIGLITFIIRTIGAYPEGVAFAVLLMNACVPLLDHLLMSADTRSSTTSGEAS